MKNRHHILWVWPFVCIWVNICAKIAVNGQTISGFVSDEKNSSLEYATVLLVIAADSSFVQGAITDKEGFYIFENISTNMYRISAGMVGYETTWTGPFAVDSDNSKNMGIIVLPEGIVKLDEITVMAQKPVYEKKADRTVINVQSNLLNKASSVLEVLSKSPGISVNKQAGSISMGGKSGVRVMINGKINRMPLDAVIQMLDGINAANVGEIELITTPPSKYEAEGNAGIINIVMVETRYGH